MKKPEVLSDQAIIALYIDSAKTFLSLSTGALALTLTFRDKIIVAPAGASVSYLMASSWSFYLLAIGAAAFYQYIAVKYLDVLSRTPGENRKGLHVWLVDRLENNPGYLYGLMLVLFMIASVLLVLAAATDMVAHHKVG